MNLVHQKARTPFQCMRPHLEKVTRQKKALSESLHLPQLKAGLGQWRVPEVVKCMFAKNFASELVTSMSVYIHTHW